MVTPTGFCKGAGCIILGDPRESEIGVSHGGQGGEHYDNPAYITRGPAALTFSLVTS